MWKLISEKADTKAQLEQVLTQQVKKVMETWQEKLNALKEKDQAEIKTQEQKSKDLRVQNSTLQSQQLKNERGKKN